MKKLIAEFMFGKNKKVSAIVLMLAFGLIAIGCGGEKPSAPPTEAESQTLVKGTLSDFADAVDKNDFAAFKANASKELQTQYTDDQMKTNFKAFTDNKAVVVPILRDAAKKDVKFSPAPAVGDQNGYSVLTTNGTIDADNQTVKINNEYVYQGGKWKLLKVGMFLE